jgi:hypothetical protein
MATLKESQYRRDKVTLKWVQARTKAAAFAAKHKMAPEDGLGSLLFCQVFPGGQKLLFIRTPLSWPPYLYAQNVLFRDSKS